MSLREMGDPLKLDEQTSRIDTKGAHRVGRERVARVLRAVGAFGLKDLDHLIPGNWLNAKQA